MTIEHSAFYNCIEIRRIYIENAKIKEQAFANCKNIRIVEMGDNAYQIGNNAFYNCFKIIFFKFSKNCNSYRINIFDTEQRLGSSLDNYVQFTSGPYSAIDDYYYGESADDIIKYEEGFYFYIKSSDKILVSIDIPEKHVVIPDWVDQISGATFLGMEEDISSVVVPTSVQKITSATVYSNIKFYFEGSDSLGSYYEIGASYFDEQSSSYIEYKSIRYFYSEENMNDGKRYWYYDEEGNVVE